MTNIEKYNGAFAEALNVTESELPGMQYNTRKEWDSVAHMQLIATLEGAFDVLFEMDDIVDLSSYEKGKEILAKYGVAF